MAKNKINFKKFLQTLILFTFTFTWFNAASASFLCVSADGHSSIENPYSSCCHQLSSTEGTDSKIFEIHSQHNCQDSLLLSNELNSSDYSKNIQADKFVTSFNFSHRQILSNNENINKTTLQLQTDHRTKFFTETIRLII